MSGNVGRAVSGVKGFSEVTRCFESPADSFPDAFQLAQERLTLIPLLNSTFVGRQALLLQMNQPRRVFTPRLCFLSRHIQLWMFLHVLKGRNTRMCRQHAFKKPKSSESKRRSCREPANHPRGLRCHELIQHPYS